MNSLDVEVKVTTRSNMINNHL